MYHRCVSIYTYTLYAYTYTHVYIYILVNVCIYVHMYYVDMYVHMYITYTHICECVFLRHVQGNCSLSRPNEVCWCPLRLQEPNTARLGLG